MGMRIWGLIRVLTLRLDVWVAWICLPLTVMLWLIASVQPCVSLPCACMRLCARACLTKRAPLQGNMHISQRKLVDPRVGKAEPVLRVSFVGPSRQSSFNTVTYWAARIHRTWQMSCNAREAITWTDCRNKILNFHLSIFLMCCYSKAWSFRPLLGANHCREWVKHACTLAVQCANPWDGNT